VPVPADEEATTVASVLFPPVFTMRKLELGVNKDVTPPDEVGTVKSNG
jgi:hypothetical protein